MAGVKKGTLVAPKSASSWWKHLRPYGKRLFWKSQRAAARNSAKEVNS
jgi:hypothetical protein